MAGEIAGMARGSGAMVLECQAWTDSRGGRETETSEETSQLDQVGSGSIHPDNVRAGEAISGFVRRERYGNENGRVLGRRRGPGTGRARFGGWRRLLVVVPGGGRGVVGSG